jgi:predicted MFS family arabinose efflux permease
MKSLSLKPSQFGLAVSAYAFSAGISGLLTAGFADKFDWKKIIAFLYLDLYWYFFMWTGKFILFLICARIITGLFGGVIGSISMAIIADLSTSSIADV